MIILFHNFSSPSKIATTKPSSTYSRKIDNQQKNQLLVENCVSNDNDISITSGEKKRREITLNISNMDRQVDDLRLQQEDDELYHFVMSVGGRLKALSPYRAALARQEIEQVLFKAKFN